MIYLRDKNSFITTYQRADKYKHTNQALTSPSFYHIELIVILKCCKNLKLWMGDIVDSSWPYY